jgi:hypothetical protein
MPDPGATRIEFMSRSDRDASDLRAMVNALAAIACGPPGYTAAELLEYVSGNLCMADDGSFTKPDAGEMLQMGHDALTLRQAILGFCSTRGNQLPSAKSLGKKLSRACTRVVDGKMINSTDSRCGAARWFVESVNQ